MCYNLGMVGKVSLFTAPHEPKREKVLPITYSEKQKEYTMNYIKEKLDEIKFRVPKGQKAIIREHAEQQGEKLTSFIIRAINETMERDNQQQAPGSEPDK